MMELSGVSYDDGSSTESEYYFELTDELEGEEAAHTLVHQYDASVTQEPFNESKPRRKEDNLECKSYRFEIKECGEISLPQGSEWSHGVASIVSNNTAVERALTIARGLTRTRQRYDALMTDTTISNASPVETKTRIETKMKTVILKKRKKVDVKLEVGSPKRVKATLSPALVTKPMDGEMKHSLENEVKEPSEMEKELACTHSQWELTGSQARLKATEIENDTLLLEMQLERHRETKSEMIASSRRTERTYPVANRRKTYSRSPSSHWKNCSNLPTSRPVEQEGRTKRDSSPVIHFSRKSRSRSPPPNRRSEERRTKSRSRSTCRASTASRSHRFGEKVPSRQHHDLEKRSSHTYKRPQSFSRSPRSVQATRGDRDRHDRHKSRYSQYDSHELKSVSQPCGETLYRQFPSCREFARISRGSQETNRETFQLQNRDYHRSRSVHNKEKLIAPQRDGHKFGNFMMEAEIPNAELATRDFRKHKSIGQRRVLPAPSASERTRRSPTKSYTRSRVIASDAFSGDGNKLKHVARHDAFERQVFKLKLREADIDEKMIAGPRDEFDNWLCNNRKRAAAEERARLMAQDLKRFEKVYASSNVMPCQLKRYQNDRDFGWRVVQFKRKQASLEDQNDQLMSLERKADLRCRLDREREKLIAENATLYHAVMLSEDQTYKQRERRAFGASANILQGSGQRAFGTNVHQGQPRLKYRTSDASDSSLFMSSANTSRVVVGAALQLKGDNVRRTYP